MCFPLHVRAVPPSVTVHNEMVIGPFGSTLVLECNVEAYPKPVHYWRKNTGQLIQTLTMFHRIATFSCVLSLLLLLFSLDANRLIVASVCDAVRHRQRVKPPWTSPSLSPHPPSNVSLSLSLCRDKDDGSLTRSPHSITKFLYFSFLLTTEKRFVL